MPAESLRLYEPVFHHAGGLYLFSKHCPPKKRLHLYPLTSSETGPDSMSESQTVSIWKRNCSTENWTKKGERKTETNRNSSVSSLQMRPLTFRRGLYCGNFASGRGNMTVVVHFLNVTSQHGCMIMQSPNLTVVLIFRDCSSRYRLMMLIVVPLQLSASSSSICTSIQTQKIFSNAWVASHQCIWIFTAILYFAVHYSYFRVIWRFIKVDLLKSNPGFKFSIFRLNILLLITDEL